MEAADVSLIEIPVIIVNRNMSELNDACEEVLKNEPLAKVLK